MALHWIFTDEIDENLNSVCAKRELTVDLKKTKNAGF